MSISGIIPPLVTPLLDHDRLDVDGLEKLIHHVLEGGVSGVFILGSTGEGPSLSYALRHELIRRACQLVDGRVSVFVGISDSSFTETVNLSRVASDCGAGVGVLAMPFYFPLGQEEIRKYIRRILPKIALPVTLYNMPALTKVSLEFETLRQLSDVEQIQGIKDSSGSKTYFESVLTLRSSRPDWAFLCGTESMLMDSVLSGGSGGVTGGANLLPRLFVDAYEAAKQDDKGMMDQLQDEIERFQAIYEVGSHASRFIKGTKCALSLAGICSDFVASPFSRFEAADQEKVREFLARMNRIECG